MITYAAKYSLPVAVLGAFLWTVGLAALVWAVRNAMRQPARVFRSRLYQERPVIIWSVTLVLVFLGFELTSGYGNLRLYPGIVGIVLGWRASQ